MTNVIANVIGNFYTCRTMAEDGEDVFGRYYINCNCIDVLLYQNRSTFILEFNETFDTNMNLQHAHYNPGFSFDSEVW